VVNLRQDLLLVARDAFKLCEVVHDGTQPPPAVSIRIHSLVTGASVNIPDELEDLEAELFVFLRAFN
jgi:hypothetical protein